LEFGQQYVFNHVRGQYFTYAAVGVVQLAHIHQKVSLTVVLIDIYVTGQEIVPENRINKLRQWPQKQFYP